MAILEDEEAPAREPVPLTLPFSYRTVRWLGMLSGGDDVKAAEIVAQMIEAIRIDDEEAHSTRH